jgi:hypothetical protein
MRAYYIWVAGSWLVFGMSLTMYKLNASLKLTPAVERASACTQCDCHHCN